MTKLLPNSENLVKKSSHFDEKKSRPKSAELNPWCLGYTPLLFNQLAKK